MNEGRHHSRAAAWGTALMGAVVVYVLSWPAVEIMCAKFVVAPRPVVAKSSKPSMLGTGTWTFPRQPYGIRMLYRPLHRLCQPYDERKLLYRYWEWWCDRFKEDAYIIDYGDRDFERATVPVRLLD